MGNSTVDYDLLNEGLFFLLGEGRAAEAQLKEYFASDQSIPDEESRDLVESWQTGREARKALFLANRGLVRDVIKKEFRNTSVSREQLHAAGDEGLIKAIDLFDETRGKFSPFARLTITDAISTEVSSVLSNDHYGSGTRLVSKARKEAGRRTSSVRSSAVLQNERTLEELLDPVAKQRVMEELKADYAARAARSMRLSASRILAEELEKARAKEQGRKARKPEELTLKDEMEAEVLGERLRQSASVEDSVKEDNDTVVTKGDAIEDVYEGLAQEFYESNFATVEALRRMLDELEVIDEEQSDYLSRAFGFTNGGKSLTPEEISDQTGVRVGRIERKLQGGMDLLRDLLEHEGIEHEDIEWTFPVTFRA